MSYLKYEVNDYIKVFSNDDKLQKVLFENGYLIKESNYLESYQSNVSKENSLKLKYLAELLLENKDYISSLSVSDLVISRYLSSKIAKIFGVTESRIINEALQYIFFSFKYSSIKSFFRINYNRFIPDYDLMRIKDKDKLRVYMEAMMQEFDRFAGIVDKIYNLNDIDKVPDDYLKYMAQLVGYEKEESTLIDDNLFRELVKNIVEVYKIKGTNYSFELFFNFLGFNVEINEYWFDRRYYNYTENQNPYTGETDKSAYTYYLTTIPPYTSRPTKCYPYEDVSIGNISKQLNVYEFSRLSKIYDPAVLLGYKKNYGNIRYTGDKYQFFKTNVAEFVITTIKGFGREEEIGQEEINILKKYIQFLIPINIIKIISFVATPVEEDASGEVSYYEESKVGEIILYNNIDGNVSRNPKVYWNFEDSSNTSYAVDVTGNGKYGNISGAAFSNTTPNSSSHSLVFNGDTDSVSATNIPYIDSRKSYSVSCFILWDGGTYGANQHRIIWSNEVQVDDNNRQVNALVLNQNGYLYYSTANYRISDGYVQSKSIRTTISGNEWYNIICTCDFGEMSIYINNQYIVSQVYEDQEVPFGSNCEFYLSPNTAVFTNGNISTRFCAFKGYIDEVAIYDRVISGQEIENINTEKKINLLYPSRNKDNTEPVAYLGFDESGFGKYPNDASISFIEDFENGSLNDWTFVGSGIGEHYVYDSKLYIVVNATSETENYMYATIGKTFRYRNVKVKATTLTGSGSYRLTREMVGTSETLCVGTASSENFETKNFSINMEPTTEPSDTFRIYFTTPATYVIDFFYVGNGKYNVFTINDSSFAIESFGINNENNGVRTKCMYFNGDCSFFKIHDPAYDGSENGKGYVGDT